MKSRKWQKSGERGFFVLKWLNFEGNDWMKSRNFRKTALFVLAVFISGCGRRTEPPLTRQADLVVCTDLELPVYEPVVKEFEERTGLTVEVQAGTLEEIRTWFAQEQTERNGDGKPRNAPCSKLLKRIWKNAFLRSEKTWYWEWLILAAKKRHRNGNRRSRRSFRNTKL